MTGPYNFGPFRQRDVLTMERFKYGDDLTRDVLTMEGRFDWGRYDFGTFRRRDVLTVGRFDCKSYDLHAGVPFPVCSCSIFCTPCR